MVNRMVDKYEPYYKRDNRLKHGIVAGLVNKGLTLDLGFTECPNPFLLDIHGLDIVAGKPLNYVKTSICDLNKGKIPYPANSFDNILACDILEHLDSPAVVVREVRRVLKDGGLFIISVPNPYYPNEVFTNVLGLYRHEAYRDWSHKQSFNPNNLFNILEAEGFKLVKVLGFRIKLPFISRALVNRHVPPAFSTQIIYVARVRK